MTDQLNEANKNRSIITGLILLFFLPILGSWYLVFFTDYKPQGGGTEHGVLINPPKKLENLKLVDPLTNETHALYGFWNMFTIINENCEQECINDLYRMRQIRLATGNDALRVQRVVYFSGAIKADRAGELFKEYSGQLLLPVDNINKSQLSLFKVNDIDQKHAIYLIDPAGFIMMVYPPGTDPGGIIKDMKHLLRISKQN